MLLSLKPGSYKLQRQSSESGNQGLEQLKPSPAFAGAASQSPTLPPASTGTKQRRKLLNFGHVSRAAGVPQPLHPCHICSAYTIYKGVIDIYIHTYR